MTANLTKADVKRLLTDPSAQVREELAAKLALHFNTGPLTDSVRRLSEDIFRALTRSAAESVRRALSENLKDNPDLPYDVALALAQDIDTVAMPILQHSVVLTDEDLIAIVRHSSTKKRLAIARRRKVPAPLAEALVDADETEVIATLVDNHGADLREPVLQKVLDRHGWDSAVQKPMAHRAKLPMTVLERLVTQASVELGKILIKRHDLPDRLAQVLTLRVREHATVNLLALGASLAEMMEFIKHLRQSGRLSPSFLLRVMCSGDVAFAEVAFSVLSGIPLRNAKLLFHDIGPLGFQSLYERSGLPRQIFPVFRTALTCIFDEPFEGGEDKRDWYRRRITQRVLHHFDYMGAGDLDYLLERALERGLDQS